MIAVILLTCTVGNGLRDRVDLIELNHFYSSSGNHAFDQLIFYEWSPDYQRLQVMAWRFTDGSHISFRNKTCTATWLDNGRVRKVSSRLFHETWTYKDPERANRTLLKEKERLRLSER